MASERLTRGDAILSYLKYVKKKWGDDGERKCRKEVSIPAVLNEGDYYPDQYQTGVMDWIAANKGMKAVQDGGRFVVQNLGLTRFLVRFMNPKTIADKFPGRSKEVYKFGRVETDASDPARIKVRLIDIYSSKARCVSWSGVCQGVLDMTRTPGKVVKTKCQLRGDDCCEFVMVTSGRDEDLPPDIAQEYIDGK